MKRGEGRGASRGKEKIDKPHIDGSSSLLPQSVVHVPQSGVALSSRRCKSHEFHHGSMTASFYPSVSPCFSQGTLLIVRCPSGADTDRHERSPSHVSEISSMADCVRDLQRLASMPNYPDTTELHQLSIKSHLICIVDQLHSTHQRPKW